MTAYADRSPAVHIDGTPMFATQGDRRAEDQIAAQIALVTGCVVHRFGMLSAVDFYAVREGRMAGVFEVKHRSHPANRYPSVFLNVRKWLALTLASAGLGVPALFVVGWEDEQRWIRVGDVDATKHRIAGCAQRVKSDSDIEPVIDVPVAQMVRL
jgi:hypothetical protein